MSGGLLQPMRSYYDTEIENGYNIIHDWWYKWKEIVDKEHFTLQLSGGTDSRFFLSWIDRSPNKDNILYINWRHKFSEFDLGNLSLKGREEELKEKKRCFDETHSFGFDSLAVTLATIAGLKETKDYNFKHQMRGNLAPMLTKIIEYKDYYTKDKIADFVDWKRKKDGVYNERTWMPYDDDQLLRLDCHQELLLFHAIIYLLYLDYKFIQFPFKSRTDKDTYSIFEFPLKRAIEIIDGWKLDSLERNNYEYNIKRLRAECAKQRPF